jgi:hypothetical protein
VSTSFSYSNIHTYKLKLTNKFNVFSEHKLNSHLKYNLTKDDYLELSNENTTLGLKMEFNTNNILSNSDFTQCIIYDKQLNEFTNYSLSLKSEVIGNINLHFTHKQDKEPSTKLKYTKKKLFKSTNISVYLFNLVYFVF